MRGIMNIVFLDIDGVLQPYDADSRFYCFDKKMKDKLIKDLSEKYNIDYAKYSIYDVLAVYYDWHPQAIARLKYVLDSTESHIITSSDWRNEHFPDKIPNLLKIHDLAKYWYKDNIIVKEILPIHEIRAKEIQDSLNKYPIDNYVVLDDMKELKEFFPNNSVITRDYMTINDMNNCIKILKKTR